MLLLQVLRTKLVLRLGVEVCRNVVITDVIGKGIRGVEEVRVVLAGVCIKGVGGVGDVAGVLRATRQELPDVLLDVFGGDLVGGCLLHDRLHLLLRFFQ